MRLKQTMTSIQAVVRKGRLIDICLDYQCNLIVPDSLFAQYQFTTFPPTSWTKGIIRESLVYFLSTWLTLKTLRVRAGLLVCQGQGGVWGQGERGGNPFSSGQSYHQVLAHSRVLCRRIHGILPSASADDSSSSCCD